LSDPVKDCPTCGLRRFETLEAESNEFSAVLCGRDAVQISPQTGADVDFHALADRLRVLGEVKFNEYLLRFRVQDHEITLFRDARAIIRGTSDIASARSLYARYVGS
jgi:adenylyltransferase/sulfurtransferase